VIEREWRVKKKKKKEVWRRRSDLEMLAHAGCEGAAAATEDVSD
jgi:hypothetical protein